MKKKNLALIAGGIFVAVALAAMLLFVFSGDGTAEPDAVTLDLEGTWKVAAYVQAGTVTIPNQEFFAFSGETASAFRDGQSIASSAYTFTAIAYPNWELNLADISRKYTVSIITDNYIRLYESSSVYMELIRYANDDMSSLHYSEDVVVGKWNVVYRNTSEVIAEEILNFGDGILDDYRNGSTEPVASVPYYWDDSGCICVDALGARMECYPLSESVILLVEVATGCVWEIHAAE